MKVLVAGLKNNPNQITRALERYDGIEPVHVWEPNKGKLPSDVDAAIIVIAQLGHNGYWRAKEHFKELEIPYWTIREGFTEIQDEFEKVMISAGHAIIRKGQAVPEPNTSMAQAFKTANGNGSTNENETSKISEGLKVSKYPPISVGVSPQEYQRLIEAYEAIEHARSLGKSIKEVVEYLNEQRVPKARANTSWKYADVHNFLNGNFAKQTRGATLAPSRISPKRTSESKSGGSNPAVSASRQNDMIQKVMASQLASEKKIELVQEILAGIRTVEHQVIAEPKGDHLQITMQSIFHEDDKPLVMLDKVTAVAILKVLKEIREFVG